MNNNNHARNMKCPLYLTPYQSSSPVIVPATIVEYLEPYNISGIRFIYTNFVKGRNVILNNTWDMNEARTICAFLVAVKDIEPTIVITQKRSLPSWYYECTKIANLKTIVIHESVEEPLNCDTIEVVLVPNTLLKLIKNLGVPKWFMLVVDNIDDIITSRYLKNIQSQCRIGLTHHNFVMNPNSKLQWSIQKWANKNLIEDYENFIKINKSYKTKLQLFHPKFWQRLTWHEIERYKPSALKIQEYKDAVDNWCIEKNINTNIFENIKNINSPTSTKKENRRTTQSKVKISKNRNKPKQVRNPVLKTIFSNNKSNMNTSASKTEGDTENEEVAQASCDAKQKDLESVKMECEEYHILDSLLRNSETVDNPSCITAGVTLQDTSQVQGNPILDSLIGISSQDRSDTNDEKGNVSEEEYAILNMLLNNTDGDTENEEVAQANCDTKQKDLESVKMECEEYHILDSLLRNSETVDNP